MKFGEYLDVLGLKLTLTRYAGQGGRWCARIDRAEVMERSMLIGAHGNAKTPNGAVNDYLLQIRGKKICIGAYSDNRAEYVVPNSIEDEP
jgi:hypothetical protein